MGRVTLNSKSVPWEWMSMENENGVTIVVLKNEGKESGTKLALGPGGMKISMKQ
jgi:hypothetical protein